MVGNQHIEILSELARSGFGYETTKRLAATAAWQLIEDEGPAAYLRFAVPFPSDEVPRLLVVDFGSEGHHPFAMLTLFQFPVEARQLAGLGEAFQLVEGLLRETLGVPEIIGEYGYSHRKWRYSYSWWSASGAEMVLVQDEFDIQEGFDLTLWVLPPGRPKELPVRP